MANAKWDAKTKPRIKPPDPSFLIFEVKLLTVGDSGVPEKNAK